MNSPKNQGHVAIGMGSNLGESLDTLKNAIQTLDEIAGFIKIDKLKKWLDFCISESNNDTIIINKTDEFFNNGYSMVNQMRDSSYFSKIYDF